MDSSSSSIPSCFEQEPFNPDRCLRNLPRLSVVKADGTQIPITTPGVSLVGGANVVIDIQDERDDISILSVPGSGQEDPYYRQKLEAIASLSENNPTVSGPFFENGSTPTGPAWSFSMESVWIGSVNNVPAEPTTGAFFVVGDNCTSVGEFEDAEDAGYPQAVSYTEEGSSSSSIAEAYLKVTDVCAPCLDCLEYQRLYDYLDRLRVFYDYIFSLTSAEDTTISPEHPDGGTPDAFVGVHQQLMAAQRYWDYLVHIHSVKLSAQSQGQSVVAAAYYRNISLDTVGLANPDGVTMTLVFVFKKDGSPWTGMSESFVSVRYLDRSGKPSATEDSPATYSPAPSSAHTITVFLKTTDPMASGEEIYADVALLFKNTNLFNDSGSDYTMDVTLTVDQTHLDPVAQTRTEIVYFQPPEPQGSS